VTIQVVDTGCGIDPDHVAHIFEPFFTTKDVGKGTGLGLATVHGVVRQHGGTISVASEPGLGAKFTIHLPEESRPLEAEPIHVAPVQRVGRETVLVVEDEDAVRDLVCEMLRMSGYTVIEARHGGEALLLCEQSREPIDLLLTDVVMPQMSGRQLAERLAPLQPDMKVLFMSGHTDDAVIRHGVKNAMMTFLQKPFTPVALARKVRAVLDAKS
jgi:CheY-like chemotaxis protein